MEPNNEEHNEEFLEPQEEIETLDNPEDEEVEYPEEYINSNNYETGNKFKDAYERAKDERGVYDKNYYANRKKELDEKVASAKEKKNQQQKEVMKKNENGEKVPTQKNKNIFDKAKDNLDLMNAKRNMLQNKIDEARAKAYNLTHPGEALKDRAKAAVKDKAKDVAKNAGKKAAQGAAKAGKAAGKAAGTAAKAAGKALASLMANPYFWLVVGIAAIILLIIILFMGTNNEEGYYDPVCDFNATTINIYTTEEKTTTETTNNTETTSSTEENTETTTTKVIETSVNLEEFVLGTTYAFVGDNDYSDDTIQAIMIILKTNTLSYGYDNTTKVIEIAKENTNYMQTSMIQNTERLEELQELYDEVAEELFISEKYEAALTTLSSEDSLGAFDVNKIEELSNTNDYEGILDELYNDGISEDEKIIYELGDYCTFYELTENDAYWWPIGSTNPTEGNIYGGTPSTLTVTSPFGLREIEGQTDNHKGIDISGGGCESNVIVATKAGTITKTSASCDNSGGYGNDCGGGYGNYVMIDHGNGIISVYAHMFPGSVTHSVGDTVEQGEKIGLMGNSGSSTGCHLHFEIRLNGVQVNPLEYVSTDNPRPVTRFDLGAVDDTASNPEETKKATCEALLNSGYSKNAVAGMLVNIKSEGGFKTNNLENCYESGQCCKKQSGRYGNCEHPELEGFGSDMLYTQGVDNGTYPRDKFVNDSAGYGLIQWTSSGRKGALYDYIKGRGKSIASLEGQLGYLLQELAGYQETYKYITGNYSAEVVATAFCKDFERPAGSTTDMTVSDSCTSRAKNNTSSMLTYVNNGCS